MVADAERLDCCKCLSVHSLTVIHTLDRHCDVLLESTVSLTSHCLVVHTCVYDSVLAGIAVSAVEVRVAGYDHSRLDAIRVVLICLDNLSGELVARDSRVIKICECSTVGTKIASADSTVKDL